MKYAGEIWLMPRKIIGHGTWYDKMALEVIQKEKKLKRAAKLLSLAVKEYRES